MLKPHIILSFADMLLCLFLVFAALFFASKLDAESQGKINDPSLFLASLEWSKKSRSDIDLFMRTPDGGIISFKTKQNDIASIDIYDVGTRKVDVVRREVISVKRLVAGRYTINGLMYTNREYTPEKVKASVLKLQGFQVLCEAEFELMGNGQEFTVCSFEIDDMGKVVSITHEQESLIK